MLADVFRLRRWGLLLVLRAYVLAALVVAAILSPLALSFVPVLLLIWYVYIWRWPINTTVRLLTEYFMLFAVALLYSVPLAPTFAFLISLPVLLLVNHALETAARFISYRESRYARYPTNIGITMAVIVAAVLTLSLLMSSLALLLVSMAVIAYLGALVIAVLRLIPLKPVRENRVQQRLVVGTRGRLGIRLTVETRIGGLLLLKSPYGWLKVSPDVLALEAAELVVAATLEPELSGPRDVKLKGQATDRWGLTRTTFEMTPIDLYVIPRARYAAWLARKYLAETGSGALLLVANIGNLRPIYGLRRGVEYYGNQVYQPGDSLRHIDWKHSLIYNELISKEFAEFQGRAAVLLVNLVSGNETEADQLAYKIIVAAISLAQETIPAALAVYNHEGVRLVTNLLQPRELVQQSLRVVRGIVTVANPQRYLSPPDLTRLRAGIGRLRFAESQASRVLTELLQLEYRSLNLGARENPATRALAEVFSRVDRQSSLVIISHLNHDAEAVAFNTFSLTRRGNAVITV